MDTKKRQQLVEKLSVAYKEKTGHALLECKKYTNGKAVYTVDDRPKGIYYICTGRVKVTREGMHGEEVVLRIAGPDDFVGFVSLIKRSDYSSSAVVVDKAEIQFIPKTVFLELLIEDVDFASQVVEILCEEVLELKDNVAGLMGMSGKQRLATLLLSLEMAFDEDTKYDNSLIRVPRKDLAAAIGTTPETISRYITDFKKRGLIDTTDGTIEIKNHNELLALSKVND